MALMQSRSYSSAQLNPVRSLFEEPSWYFRKRAFDVQIRQETVQELLGQSADARVLDIGCGDGSISLPLLTEGIDLTLLDLSETMLSIAKAKTPPRLSQNVKTVNEDFMKAAIEPESFDIILCIGLLAHVESPAEVIAKIVSSLKSKGIVIVECTDSKHISSRLVAILGRLWGFFRPAPYQLQVLTYAGVRETFARHQLYPVASFRYGAPLPGVHRLLSQDTLYRLSRWIFGTPATNRNKWLGNEYIAVFASRVSQRQSRSTGMVLGVLKVGEYFAEYLLFIPMQVV